eukprot:1888923-Lingulodinium_polyedra.AAC.1
MAAAATRCRTRPTGPTRCRTSCGFRRKLCSICGRSYGRWPVVLQTETPMWKNMSFRTSRTAIPCP